MQKRLQKPAWAIITFVSMVLPQPVLAVPPPDFLIQVASQFTAFFVVGLAFFSALLSVSYQFVKAYASTHRKTFWTIATVGVLATSLAGAYLLDQQYQRGEQSKLTETWLKDTSPIKSAPPEDDAGFYAQYKHLDDAISNAEFRDVLSRDATDFVILDAREPIEYELGHIPGSLHMRFADLTAGGWAELPTDTIIYVICFSGMRGEEVTDFLRERGIVARFLEKGAFDWVKFGGKWEGEVDFYKVFAAERYTRPLSPDAVTTLLAAGAILVDAREQQRYRAGHPDGAINIPTLFEPSDRLEASYAQVDPGSRVITLCDDLASCFDATVTGIELEKRGVEFLGIWNISPENPSS